MGCSYRSWLGSSCLVWVQVALQLAIQSPIAVSSARAARASDEAGASRLQQLSLPSRLTSLQRLPVVITMHGTEQLLEDSMAKCSIQNKDMYARKHGYKVITNVITCDWPPAAPPPADMQHAPQSDLHGPTEHSDASVRIRGACLWSRLAEVHRTLQSLPDGTWLWSVDIDTIITNLDQRLEELIESAQTMPHPKMQHQPQLIVAKHVGSSRTILQGRRPKDTTQKQDGSGYSGRRTAGAHTRRLHLAGDGRGVAAAHAAMRQRTIAAAGADSSPRDLIVATRCNVTNVGSFLMRASTWSRAFLGEVLSMRDTATGRPPRLCLSCPDQDVFDAIMRHPGHALHVALVPARWINGMPIEQSGNRCGSEDDAWTPHDSLLIHFAGKRRAKLLFKKYWKANEVAQRIKDGTV